MRLVAVLVTTALLLAACSRTEEFDTSRAPSDVTTTQPITEAGSGTWCDEYLGPGKQVLAKVAEEVDFGLTLLDIAEFGPLADRDGASDEMSTTADEIAALEDEWLAIGRPAADLRPAYDNTLQGLAEISEGAIDGAVAVADDDAASTRQAFDTITEGNNLLTNGSDALNAAC